MFKCSTDNKYKDKYLIKLEKMNNAVLYFMYGVTLTKEDVSNSNVIKFPGLK